MSRLTVLVSFLSLVFLTTSPNTTSAQTTGVTGMVVDTQDRAIVRAHVRLVDEHGATVATTLTDARGAFRFAQTCVCRLEADLPGFLVAAVPVASTAVRLVLTPAPVSESVVVTATRDAMPSSQTGAALTVFDAEAIERRGRPLVSDLLRATPGATVVRVGGFGNVTSLFVRGGESSYNKVLIDGIPMNEPGGTFNFSNLTTVNIDRVEMVRGAQSALFGSDAMSSVVQLFTRRGTGVGARPEVNASWEGGSLSTRRVSAGMGGRTARLDYSVAVSEFSTDNRVPNNAFDNTTVSWNLGGQITPQTSLRAVGRLEDQRAGTPGATAFGRPDLDASFARRDGVAGLTLERRQLALSQRVTYAFSSSTQESTNLVADPSYTPTFGDRQAPFQFSDFTFDNRNVLRRHHLSYQVDWRPSSTGARGVSQFITALVDYDGERADLENRMAGTSLPASRDNVGLSVQHQFVTSRLAMTSSVRVERNDSFGTTLVPRVSVAQVLRRQTGLVGRTTLTFNAGLGVKEPTILQSFSTNFFFRGNPDLEAERARTVDLGIQQRLAGDRVRLELVGFHSRYRNQISTRTIDFNTFEAQYFNIGRTRARGVELTADVAPMPGLQARAGYTFLDSRIEESTSTFSPVFAVGQWAFRRPRHSGYLDVTASARRLTLGLSGLFVGRRVDSDFASLNPPIVESDAYATWRAMARYRISPAVEWFLRIENLTNRQYLEPAGYPAWGRTSHTGVRVRF